MKGIATIQLINAESGEIKETKEVNLITDAINDIFNQIGNLSPKFPILASGFLNTDTGVLLDIPKYFGGCALMEEIQNTADYFPKGKFLGIAGSTSSRSDLSSPELDGIRIVGETMPIVNGYQWTWEWGTVNGNGTINSICLMPESVHDLASISGRSDTRGLPLFDDGVPQYEELYSRPQMISPYLYFDIRTTGTILKAEYKLGPETNFTTHRDDNSWEYTDITGDVQVDGSANCVRCSIDTIYFLDHVGVDSVVKSYAFDGTLLNTITLDRAGYKDYGWSKFEIVGNYLLAVHSYPTPIANVGVFNLTTGALLRTIPIQCGDYIKLDNITFFPFGSDNIVAISSGGTNTGSRDCFLTVADYATGSVLLERLSDIAILPDALSNSKLLVGPITKSAEMFISGYNSSGKRNYKLDIFPLFQSTINNLGSPLVKTSADILKVTYRITTS